MLANRYTRHKAGIIRRNGGPYWRGLVGLYTWGEYSGVSNSNGVAVRPVNHAFPNRPHIMNAGWGSWDTSHNMTANKQGHTYSKTEGGGFFIGNAGLGMIRRLFSQVNTTTSSVAFFMDTVNRQTNPFLDMVNDNWQQDGFGVHSMGAFSNISGTQYNIGTGGRDTSNGARNKIFGCFQKGQLIHSVNGQSNQSSGNQMTARDNTFYILTGWGDDVEINLVAIWIGAKFSTQMARRLTVHPNPIEFFR